MWLNNVIISARTYERNFRCHHSELHRMRESRGGDRGSAPSAEKSQKYSFFRNTSPDSLKNQANIQCWAIIGLRADDGPLLMVFGSSLPLQKLKMNWTPSDKTSAYASIQENGANLQSCS